MSQPIQPVQAAHATPQVQPAVQPPKQAPAQSAAPQDKVTISDSAKQALANSAKPAGGG